jgi:hypothetical protein
MEKIKYSTLNDEKIKQLEKDDLLQKNVNYYDILSDYLEENGFHESDYSGKIYWHHEKCEDVLFLDSNGCISLYSLPPELSGKDFGFPKDEKGNKLIYNKNHVDILSNALKSINDKF